jgi:hypothetical protein
MAPTIQEVKAKHAPRYLGYRLRVEIIGTVEPR